MPSVYSPGRPWKKYGVAIALSLATHLVVGGGAMSLSGPPKARPAEPMPVEVVSIPVEPEPEPEPVPEPEPEPEEPDEAERSEPDRPQRPARPLLAALQGTVQPSKTMPIPLEPLPEPVPEPRPSSVPIPAELFELDPAKAARQELLRGQARLSEEDQMAKRVAERVNGIARSGLTPRTNDKAAFPELVPDAEGNLTWHRHGLTAKILPDGTVDFQMGRNPLGRRQSGLVDESGRPVGMVPGGGGIRPPLDLNDLMGMAHGDDPRAAWKRWFLRQTDEMRGEMAQQHRKQALAKAPSAVNRNLGRIWSDGTLSGAAKRLLLFQLWDECEEAREENDERVEATVGQRSRRQILGFIREKAPPGTAHAFTPGELRILNRRRDSLQTFDPY